MKVMLLNAPALMTTGVIGFLYPPLGILYVASYAREKMPGIDIRAMDGYHEDFAAIPGIIKDYNPSVLGVSFTTQACTGAYEIINQIKKLLPDMLIVAGGPHPTLMAQEIFEKSEADLVVVGEGEETFFEILEAKENGRSLDGIPGTVQKQDGKAHFNPTRPLIRDLDTIPFPARDLIDLKKYPGYYYKKRNRDTSLMSARGCPFDCVFCSNPVWKHQKPWYRVRSAKNIADEMEYILKTYGISEFFDETDEFNGNLKWAKSVCDEITGRKMDIVWKAQMRADNIDDELASKMFKSGCWLAFFGVESGNDKTLKGIGKKLDVATIERALGTLKRGGLMSFALLMAFNVWEEDGKLCFENKEDTLRTLAFAKRLVRDKKIDLLSWSLTTPFPGSKLYEIALKHKLIPPEKIGRWELWDPSANFVMKLPGITDNDWMEVQNQGKRLQARLLLTSGAFNIKSMPLYLKKGFGLIARSMGKVFSK